VIKMLAAAARDIEASSPQKLENNAEELASTDVPTPVKSSKKAKEELASTDVPTPVKASKKSKAISEDSIVQSSKVAKELALKQSDSNVEEAPTTEANLLVKPSKNSRERTISEGSNKENLKAVKEPMTPRARSALKRRIEQEKAQSERRAKDEALEKTKDEEAFAADAEAARARRQAKWDAKQEAAILSEKMSVVKEEKAHRVRGDLAKADEESAQLQALVAEAEAAAAALAKRSEVLKPEPGVAPSTLHQQPSSAGCVAPTEKTSRKKHEAETMERKDADLAAGEGTFAPTEKTSEKKHEAKTMEEKDVDDIDLAEWEIL